MVAETRLGRTEAARELQLRRQARAHVLPFRCFTSPKYQPGKHHELIAAKLEAVERGEVRKLMIFAPPRSGKSELVSKAFPPWYLGRNPGNQIMACSYAAHLATGFGRDTRNLVADPVYRTLFPDVALAADSAAAGLWHTNQGGVYLALGVGGPAVGHGFNVGIIDDPFKSREEADSQIVRDKVWDWYWSTFESRMMPGAAIVLMHQRWHEDDLAGRLLAKEGAEWDVLALPAIVDEDTPEERALWPEWWPLDVLRERRESLRRVGKYREWQALYQQNPQPEQGDYCKREWFATRYETRPEPLNVYMASDFAVTEAREGADPDYTEHGVFGIAPDDTLVVLDWWSGQTTADEWIERLLDLVERHRPLCWFGEGGVIRRAIEPFLIRRCRERKVYFRQEWLTPIHDKAVRGRAFQGRSSMGLVRFGKQAWAERVVNQCVGFPGKHDDAFDVMATMCLAIDQAHPAIVQPKDTRPRDRWLQGDEDGSSSQSWKVA